MQAPIDEDLEDLLSESQPTSDTDPLDELLAESMAEVKEKQAAKAARDRLKRGGQSSKERAEDEERIRRWELQNEWRPVANVALFDRTECDCGRHSTAFVRLMTRQVHRHLGNGAQRWEAADAAKADLPNEVAVRKFTAPLCPACAPAKGWLFRNVTEFAE